MNYQGFNQYQIPTAYGQNQYQSPYQPASQQPAPPRQNVVQVSGRNGAEAYPMGPDSSALLLDQTAPIVWLKKTDGAGYPTMIPYDIAPHQTEGQIDLKSLEDRVARLEEELNDGKESDHLRGKQSNGKSTENGKN